jgi:hypothetical protein
MPAYLLVPFLIAGVVGALAQGRPALRSTLDLAVPFAPSAVRVMDRTSMVYELHVTNFQASHASLTRVVVLTGDGRPIADLHGEDLRARIGRPGLPRGHANPEALAPGVRAVIYFWIDLPDAVPVPRALRHRLEVTMADAEGVAPVVIESAPTAAATAVPVTLAPPLRGGPWTAIYDPQLAGGHRTAIYTIDGRARIPGRFAIDFIRLPPGGAMPRDPATRSTDWNGYGDDVLAVADAVVVAAVDDMADNANTPAGARPRFSPEAASGNYVALDIGGGRFAFYEHLRHRSITVRQGDRVKRGQVIGRLGYSGSSSIGPHLHFHVGDANSTLGAEGLPFVFTAFDRLGSFASIGALVEGEPFRPDAGTSPRTRMRERPDPNAVIQFR